MLDWLFGDPERDPRAVVRLRWLSAEEGGRKTRAGPRYVATARFAAPGGMPHDVGVVLELGPDGQLGTLRLLVPEDAPEAAARIRPGEILEILEGARVVARAEVQYVAGLGEAPSA